MSDEFNMSMRKFLKQVGVTAQQEIEQALRAAIEDGRLTGGSVRARAVITIDEVDLTHTVEGQIRLGDGT